VGKEADVLKRSGYPDGCHLMNGKTMQVVVLVAHPAGARRKESAQNIDKGRLTRPVWADQAVDDPGLNNEGNVLQGLYTAKPAGNGFNGQPVHPADLSIAEDRLLEKREARPLGRKRITRSRISPLIPMRIGPAVTPTPRKTSGRAVSIAAPRIGPYQTPIPPTIL